MKELRKISPKGRNDNDSELGVFAGEFSESETL
jgi:hypothetical protein